MSFLDVTIAVGIASLVALLAHLVSAPRPRGAER
jgi:hypothetical protein